MGRKGRKQRRYSYEEWKRAMDLHNRFKLGSIRISRILGIPEDTVKGWIYYGKMPPMAKWVAEPCIELGYVIGVLHHGDGNISIERNNGGYAIRLDTIDKEFVETFSRALARLLSRNYHESRWNKKRKQWRRDYCSKTFYTWYKKTEEQGIEGFKSFIEYNRETVKYYLRGLYDSEGSNNRNKYIFLYNSDKELLEYMQHLLKKYFNMKPQEYVILSS